MKNYFMQFNDLDPTIVMLIVYCVFALGASAYLIYSWLKADQSMSKNKQKPTLKHSAEKEKASELERQFNYHKQRIEENCQKLSETAVLIKNKNEKMEDCKTEENLCETLALQIREHTEKMVSISWEMLANAFSKSFNPAT